MSAPTAADLLVHTARRSLAVYLGSVHRTDEGRAAIPPAHLLRHVIPVLEDDTLGHTVIIAPPSSAKTNTMIGASAWWLGRDPSEHIAYVCNTDRRAYERSVAIRDTIELNPQYRALFPALSPDKAKGWAEFEWYLGRPNIADKDPSLLAAGVGASILGARISRGVLDDIADEDNMATELQREKVIRWLSKTFMTRIMPGGRVIMICTRWHEMDPAAWAIAQGWHVVQFPALDDDGSSYWPEVWPADVLACPGDQHPDRQCCKKRELGSLAFAQQYLGRVVSDEAALFKRQWWRRYEGDPPAEADRGCISVDTAGWDEKNPTSDRAVLAVWLTTGGKYYVPQVVAGRFDYPDVRRIAKDLAAGWALPVVVEDTPWARPLIQDLQRDIGNVIAWKIEGRSKVNRAKAVISHIEAGDVYLPADEPWVDGWIAEHAAFPLGAHDDQVDTTTMALLYLAGRPQRRGTPGRTWSPRWQEVRA